jgi:hypothetical protein
MVRPEQIEFALKARANDREVTPGTIGLSLFNQFNQEVESFLAGGQKRAALDEVHLEISEGSYRLLLTLPFVVAAMVEPDLQKLHREDALAEIDPKRAEIVKKWQVRAREGDYKVEINSTARKFPPIHISSETDYRAPDEDEWVAVEKYLTGRVVDMGGTTAANVHLVSDDSGRRFVATSSEDFLRGQKENYLYRKVQVHVAALENIKTGALKDIRLLAFIGKGPSYDEAELEALIEKGTKAWADVPDSAAWVRQIRGNDDE